MTDLSERFAPGSGIPVVQRGSLPDAPLVMPTQMLESSRRGWVTVLVAPLRLLLMPSRGV